MKYKPIIMGAESVRAILDGRKTQTRRVVNKRAFERFIFSPSGELLGSFNESHPEWEIYPTFDDAPYRVGDRLWVRETWATLTYHEGDVPIHIVKDNKNIKHDVVYYAECPDFSWFDGDGFQEYRKDGMEASHWKSPIFMPRWASRITLEITDIRVERLQDITAEDALKEGFCNYGTDVDTLDAFCEAWQKLNAKRGYPWESNPWVWCIGFKRVHDQKEGV